MRKLETQLWDGTRSVEARDAHIGMNVVNQDMSTFQDDVGMSSLAGRRLSGVMSAYRLMDVLFCLRHPSTPYQNPRYGRLPLKGLLPSSKVKTFSLASRIFY